MLDASCALKDEMTPHERMGSLMQGKPIDRIPCVPMIGAVAAKLIGVHVNEMLQSPRLTADAQIRSYELFHHDSVSVCIGSHAIATAFGGRMTDPVDDNPAMKVNPIQTEQDLDRLDLADLDKCPAIQVPLEAAKILVDRLGGEVGTGLIVGGPFSVASSLRGTNFLLREIIRNPEFAHRLIEFSLQCSIRAALPFLREGVSPLIVDPVASGSILDRKKAAEFAFAYTRRLIKEFQKYAPAVVLHICGNTRKLLDQMADSGAACLSLDNVVDLEQAKKQVGDRVMLNGNVDPVNVMFLGNKDLIHQAVKTCLAKAWDNPRGYILATGCDLPIKTPVENIAEFVDAARIYGKWPLDPKNFS
ncbi:uroporphyrinogen decarboxylase family protein [Candidatus Formimonas warabiya]|uniref:Uroporphyrinogen decarboxylase (URO-D) domain-containing protein n=1 Tax=Formimonas warabiya TaxID=1761012 RepID=A0A3G1KZG1_FORW1|nr:uroporphyrinogen decarboxylase family protein [Candidatus Formimonas warabiya]ATW27797.1 hypothetical protein DCMF_26290 [Candidatus Formimonas warabiya]